jgi:phospholipid N-methyltransferase
MRQRTNDAGLFASNFFRNPYMLGSIVPSSRFLVDAMLAAVEWPRARVFVEYGPGVGTFTKEILRRMSSDATLLVIETNLEFVKFLSSQLNDPRLILEHDSAQNVQCILERCGIAPADYVVSGVPLGSMPKTLQSAIAVASREALRPAGELLVYQFTSRTLPVLRQTFRSVRRGFELRNFPPAQLFVCSDTPGRSVAI